MPTVAALARYVHWRIRVPHTHAWHQVVSWPYRALFGTIAPTGTMYDDISADGDPVGGDGYAGYVNGRWADYAATKARFPSKPTKSISVWGTDAVALSADIGDCEFGDYTPPDIALWAHLKITGGYGRPTIYSSTSQYAAIATELAAYGLQFGRDVDWLEAHYDGLAFISSNPGAIGKQYQSTNNYDASVVILSWLVGTTPPPTPTPQEITVPLASVQTLSNGNDVVVQIGADGTVYGKVREPSQTWQESSNTVLASAVVGSTPTSRVSGGQYQCFIENAGNIHVWALVTNDGVTWGKAELP